MSTEVKVRLWPSFQKLTLTFSLGLLLHFLSLYPFQKQWFIPCLWVGESISPWSKARWLEHSRCFATQTEFLVRNSTLFLRKGPLSDPKIAGQSRYAGSLVSQLKHLTPFFISRAKKQKLHCLLAFIFHAQQICSILHHKLIDPMSKKLPRIKLSRANMCSFLFWPNSAVAKYFKHCLCLLLMHQ